MKNKTKTVIELTAISLFPVGLGLWLTFGFFKPGRLPLEDSNFFRAEDFSTELAIRASQPKDLRFLDFGILRETRPLFPLLILTGIFIFSGLKLSRRIVVSHPPTGPPGFVRDWQ